MHQQELRLSGSIRLACGMCDTDECDGVSMIPEGWEDVREDTLPVEDDTWWTHLGTCPDCAAQNVERRK